MADTVVVVTQAGTRVAAIPVGIPLVDTPEAVMPATVRTPPPLGDPAVQSRPAELPVRARGPATATPSSGPRYRER